MTIDGECVSASRRAAVRIASLASTGCELLGDGTEVPVDGEVSLWIGAIGPLAATATRREGSGLSARFKEPLDPRILEHFDRW